MSAAYGLYVHASVRWFCYDSLQILIQGSFLQGWREGNCEKAQKICLCRWFILYLYWTLAELKQSLTTVLYSQWDQLAQFAMPLHLDVRILLDSGKARGQDLWQYQWNEKNLPISSHRTTDHDCLSLTSTVAEQAVSKMYSRKSLSSNSFNDWPVLPVQRRKVAEGNSWPPLAATDFEIKWITVQI